jgi:hypothetical protein
MYHFDDIEEIEPWESNDELGFVFWCAEGRREGQR